MQFSVRISDYQKNTMLNMCDAELIGKEVVDGELKININESNSSSKLLTFEFSILLKSINL